MPLRSIVPLLTLTLGLAFATATPARAQYPGLWPTYGVYGYPMGYGFGYPGAAAIGYGGWGYGGWGYPGFGYGFGAAIGYPPIAPYAYAPTYAGGYSMYAGYGGWLNPAALSLGVAPLAVESAVMERGLRGTLPTRTTTAPAPASAPSATATVPLTPGTYRITVERIEPRREPAENPKKP